ncbi:MAG: pyruvate dehydrogenase subunit E1, partial [uncultured bacterium]
IKERRAALGGPVPFRQTTHPPLPAPPLSDFKALLASSKDRELSTTMAFVRLLGMLVKDKAIGNHIVPIVPDEARTFGMEGLFRQLGIYAPTGQLYEPQDSEAVAWYKEDPQGQILEEGITEAGAVSSWLAAATAHSNYGVPMIPFYAFYSMFGFQRVGDQLWAAGDNRAKGFLLGATSGRTTLNGEGLQHQDGQGLLFASAYPTCQAYDPTFSYEVAVLVQQGIGRMFAEGEDVFYYITLLNENYPHPEMPQGVEDGIGKGMYLFRRAPGEPGEKPKVQLMGSGTILREVIAAADLLAEDFGVQADIWSILGVNQLHRQGMIVDDWNRYHPDQPRRKCYVEEQLAGHAGPVIIATDYVQAYPEQLRRFIDRPLTVLGTDGFGRSDSRAVLRNFFKVDRYHVVVAALRSLADEGQLPRARVSEAMEKYGINPDTPHAVTR